jgi:tetratricopeptide (TPR) repeat protein
LKAIRRLLPIAGLLMLAGLGLDPNTCFAQSESRTVSGTPQIHKDFPYQTMWDDALAHAQTSRRPVLVFDIDLIDTNSVALAQEVLTQPGLRAIISSRFEPALNDFAVDPPLSVGLDSLRVLGQRLSGLERRYRLSVRPTLIVIAPDSTEIDRIVFANRLSVAALSTRLLEISEGKNTFASMIHDFWADTTSTEARQALIDKFEEHAMYDSVIYHLESLQSVRDSSVARGARIRYSILRLQIEGVTAPIRSLIASLGHNGADSVMHYEALQQILQTFQKRKLVDSVNAVYEELLAFTGDRAATLLNDYAWFLAGYTKDRARALALVDEALVKQPDDADFLDTRALILGQLGRFDEAIRTEQRAYDLAPQSDKAAFKESIESLKARKQAVYDEAHPKKVKKSETKKSMIHKPK